MSTEPQVPAEDDLPEQLRIRREKRLNLIERGIEPYPVTVPRTHLLAAIREKYRDLETDTATGDQASLVGRIIFKRDTGNSVLPLFAKVMALKFRRCYLWIK